jgi:hypothetical protein
MQGGRGSQVRACLQFLNTHPDLILYNAESLRAIHDALRQIVFILAWLLFWWSKARREAMIPHEIEPLGEGFMRDLLEQEAIQAEKPDVEATDIEYENTDE